MPGGFASHPLGKTRTEETRWCLPETEALGDREAFAGVGSMVRCFSSLKQLKTAGTPCAGGNWAQVLCCSWDAHSNPPKAGLSSPFPAWIPTLPAAHGCKLWRTNW